MPCLMSVSKVVPVKKWRGLLWGLALFMSRRYCRHAYQYALPNNRDSMSDTPQTAGDLFRHVNADKARLYRMIMESLAAAKRQFRLQLRLNEVRLETAWQARRRDWKKARRERRLPRPSCTSVNAARPWSTRGKTIAPVLSNWTSTMPTRC